MNYGPHDNLVQEVLEYLDSNDLLAAADNVPPTIVAIDDYEAAKEMAFRQFFGASKLSWSDIREAEMAEAMNAPDEGENYRLFDEFFDVVASKARFDSDYDEIANEIVSDILNVCYWRAVYGSTNGLFEQMLEVYRNGGWPCGWQGDWPGGQLVAFFPPSKSE